MRRKDGNYTLDEVTVCSRCRRACCWQLTFTCAEASKAKPVKLPITTVRELGLEHPDFWTKYWAEMGEARRR
jgi:hypothetical protein